MARESAFGAEPEQLRELLSFGLEDLCEPDVTPTASLGAVLERPGGQIGRYKLHSVLGEGGMGIVYLAEQEEPIRRRVALKVIKPGMDSKRVIARFEAVGRRLREAVAAGELTGEQARAMLGALRRMTQQDERKNITRARPEGEHQRGGQRERTTREDLAGEPSGKEIKLFNGKDLLGWDDQPREEARPLLRKRDEIMAENFIREYEQILASGAKRNKCLVIMNYRHDVFTGFIFYKPLEEHMNSMGFKGMLSDNFDEIIMERASIIGEHAKNEFSEKLQLLKESETVTDYVSYATLRSKMDSYLSALILLAGLLLSTWKYLR